jgi:hypothetical protein
MWRTLCRVRGGRAFQAACVMSFGVQKCHPVVSLKMSPRLLPGSAVHVDGIDQVCCYWVSFPLLP